MFGSSEPEGTHRYADRVRDAARKTLPEEVFRYFSQGSAAGISAGEAEGAWDRFRFLPRILMDVTDIDIATTVLGTELRSPFAIGPTTLQRAAHPEGEVAMARAAAESGSLVVVSSNAGSTFEDIGATGAAWWVQMYVTADRATTAPVVARAVEAGARAIVLTADTPVVGTKYDGTKRVWDAVQPDWLRVNFPPGLEDDPGVEKATDLGPQDIAWLANRFHVPVVVKGVLHPADARRCVDAGAAAVWVSNHGGRQLDRAVAPAEMLGAVSEAVDGEVEVYVDGGIRRGVHAVTAAALGARASFLGRPPLYALTDRGSEGVTELLSELAEEVVEVLRLSGCARLHAVTRALLHGL